VAPTIFIVDSSPAVRRMVEQISTPEGFQVMGFHDGPAALEAAQSMSPSLIIADYHLDNMTFSGFCKKVHESDNLVNTYIVSLVSATDKLDESHLKSLGVKAFLKKPFHSENLLELIKDIHMSAVVTNGGKKKRSWPPTSSSTDGDEPLEELDPVPPEEEEALNPTISFPTQSKAPAKKGTPLAPTPMEKQAATEPEDAMKGLVGQLMQSVSEKTEKKIADLLPKLVRSNLVGLVAKAVETELHQHLGTILSQERLTQAIKPLLMEELPKVLTNEMALLEPIIRHSILEIANPLIKENIDQIIREQTKKLNATLPDAVREHLKSIEGQVQREIKLAAEELTGKLSAEIIRAAADVQIEQAVQRLIPAIAEEQIKAEITRLSAAA
jgi:CheY-like chemotaxis protein